MIELSQVQLCVFGDFKEINATNEVFTRLLQEFSGFLPMTIPSFQIDVRKNKLSQIDKIKIVDSKSGWSIFAQDERIDVTLDVVNGTEDNNIVNIIDKGKEYLAKFVKTVSIDKLYSRLAINTRMVISNDETKPKIPFLNEQPSFIGSEKDLKEWKLSVNKEGVWNIHDGEKTNEIVTLSLGYSTSETDKYATIIVIDVNTVPENNVLRFSADDMDGFAEYAVNRMQQIKKDLERE